MATAGWVDLAEGAGLRNRARLALAAGVHAAAGAAKAPGHGPGAGGRLRARLRANQPACAGHACRHRGRSDRTGFATTPALIGRTNASRFNQETMKVTRKLTRHSLTTPSGPVTTLISLTQAPWMFFTVSEHFFRPDCTASSMDLVDDELISMILATDMGILLGGGRWKPVVAGL